LSWGFSLSQVESLTDRAFHFAEGITNSLLAASEHLELISEHLESIASSLEQIAESMSEDQEGE
jgi:hypothetical protein